MADKQAPLDTVVSSQSEPKPEGSPLARPTKRSRLRAHCGRFWILYLVAVVAFLAVFLPILFTIIIPAAAQNMVNKAYLPIHSGSLEAISNDKVAIALITELYGPSDIKVRMDPFEVHLYDKGNDVFYPFASLSVPAHTLKGRTQITIPKETVPIKNHTEFNKWLGKAIYHKKTNVSVKAETMIHLGAIKSHINIDKTASLAGLDQLSGMRIDSINLVKAEENNGNSFQGTFILPNYSPLSIGLGNLTLNIWTGEVLIGNASVTDVYLKPGNNTIPFTGQIFLEEVMMNSVDIIPSQKPSLAKGYLELGISGNSTTVNGEHITYIEDVLNGIRIKAQLNEHEILSGLARSLIGPDKTVTLSDMLSEIMPEGVDALDIMDLIGVNITAWHMALKGALEGNTKTGTLLALLGELAK
ncbi:hypothetical protein VP1G_03622 [Cytospora mali]|uniref:Uncharacterized protein n=1 Tax=Cytospora mali TaxID=578113 RepID=A0A194UXD3_CYTMA|nr:hypothetical protein VP1G_03622 [Valsa mali var. pyri (nom. inval.)]